MPEFTVSLVQTDLHWHDAAANRAALAEQLATALDRPGLTDLIVLPEMFTAGFSMEAATQAEPADGPTLAWLREQAAYYDAVVTGSVMVTHAWQTLLQARAIENLAYVVGVNRIGTDGLGNLHSGHSVLLDMRGEYLAQAGSLPTVLTRRLLRHPLQEVRAQLSALTDADGFELS
ncbi:MAG: hypothetical protein EOO59_02335 [Hymenobacter sp.]|nr:MAG: hypothetical protein EOO59_02335 [Hymenobacter sp.]